MNTLDLAQGSDEWRLARCGSLGASQVHEALAKTKSGAWGAGRANIMAALICERLTGIPEDGYVSAAMTWGTETEAQARVFYELIEGVSVSPVGLIRHPRIVGAHSSPDGLVGDDGAVEIKCPNSATHIETICGAKIPAKYATQVQWHLACSGRAWCDFISFDPRMPEDLRMIVQRVPRDAAVIAEMEEAVIDFLAELDGKVAELQRRRMAA